jgi:hypothetical protein
LAGVVTFSSGCCATPGTSEFTPAELMAGDCVQAFTQHHHYERFCVTLGDT